MSNTEAIRETIDAAARRAVDYWGTAHDEEDLILAELECGGLTVSADDFRIMVEELIAIEDADSSRDLSAYGWSANPSADELSAFEAERRENYDATLTRAVDDLTDAVVVPFPVRAARLAA